MTSSIPPAGRQAAQNTTRNLIGKGSPVLGIFTLISLAATYKMMQDTYHGNHEREEQEAAMHQANKDYAFAAYDWGRWSGQPHMDNLAHSWMGFKLYGPYGIKEQLQETGVKIHSIWKEVIVPNLIPLGISVASLYGFFGPQAINSKLSAIGSAIFKPIFKPEFGSSIGKFAGRAFDKTLEYTTKGITKAMKHIGVTTGVLFLGAYALKRFNDAYSGQGQREYFRHELWENDGMEE